jgi:replicative superfamily II helicase
MVDFEKLLGKKILAKPIDPIQIFSDLDKESGKEYLREPQIAVLKEWFTNYRDNKDNIVKLHTGEGKTLIGLLMLQSLLNEGKGPVVYLCPNKYLIAQTVDQARSFGIKTIQISPTNELPREFLNSESILVTTCHRLFNGKSIFGVKGTTRPITNIGAVVMDDAHKCLDIIKTQFSIKIENQNEDGTINDLYQELFKIFEDTLNSQAEGTFSDICSGADSFIAVPFWVWDDRKAEVIKVLQKYKDSDELKFVWDLLKDKIVQSTCIFSGKEISIIPRLLPIPMIPSFHNSPIRIFLSATLTEDAFLIKDLAIEPKCVANPLMFKKSSYGGERLVIIPTLVDIDIRKNSIISLLDQIAKLNGHFGIVTIVPSFGHSYIYEDCIKTDGEHLYESIELYKVQIKQKKAKKILALVNQYDGIDLPDSTCRILCLDSLPKYISLYDRYLEAMRPGTSQIRRLMAQKIEQGMGRAIRGPSDWCIVIILGNDLTNFLSETSKRKYFSKETQMQISIGEELASDMRKGGKPLDVIVNLIFQSLNRDDGWKEFYKDRMSRVTINEIDQEFINLSHLERTAELLFQQGQHEKAIETAQQLVNQSTDPNDRGWYYQLMATYTLPIDHSESMKIQLKAHTENEMLSRPPVAIKYQKLITSHTNRAKKILEFIHTKENSNAMILHIDNLLSKINFNTSSEVFEESIRELGIVLGFNSHRPEKTTGRGPDNLWHIQSKDFWIIECKNMASSKTIAKKYASQLNTSIAWFKEEYQDGENGIPVMIHQLNMLDDDAFLNETGYVIQKDQLEKLKKNTQNFYNSLSRSFSELTSEGITKKLSEYELASNEMKKYYLKPIEKKIIS